MRLLQKTRGASTFFSTLRLSLARAIVSKEATRQPSIPHHGAKSCHQSSIREPHGSQDAKKNKKERGWECSQFLRDWFLQKERGSLGECERRRTAIFVDLLFPTSLSQLLLRDLQFPLSLSFLSSSQSSSFKLIVKHARQRQGKLLLSKKVYISSRLLSTLSFFFALSSVNSLSLSLSFLSLSLSFSLPQTKNDGVVYLKGSSSCLRNSRWGETLFLFF